MKESFLLDIWVEGREMTGVPQIIRGRCRNLRSGESRYLSSPDDLLAFLEHSLDIRGFGWRAWQRGSRS